jgi:hypothetical protein
MEGLGSRGSIRRFLTIANEAALDTDRESQDAREFTGSDQLWWESFRRAKVDDSGLRPPSAREIGLTAKMIVSRRRSSSVVGEGPRTKSVNLGTKAR